ncbi:MAG: hypothetical protein ABSH20_27585, partial [Tepidisphaeraceae bacterium]
MRFEIRDLGSEVRYSDADELAMLKTSRKQRNASNAWKSLSLGIILLAVCAISRAEYPLLEQLNQQTQSLYNEVQSGIV